MKHRNNAGLTLQLTMKKRKKKSFPLDLSNFLPIPVYLEGAFFTQSGMCIPF